MAKLLDGPSGMRAMLARLHGNERRVLIPIGAVMAITEGVQGQDEHKSAVHVGGPHPIRLSDPFVEIASTLMGAPLDIDR